MAQAPQAATYTNDPAGVPVDRVRLEIGDTDCANAFLSDAEVELYIDKEDPDASGVESVLLRAASHCASLIAARVARRMNFSHGGVKKDAGSLFEHFNDLAAELGRRASIAGAIPEVLGRTKAEKEAADQDESAVQPDFKKGMTDNPRSGPTVLSEPGEVTSV